MADSKSSRAVGSEPLGKPVGEPRSFRHTFPFVPPAHSHLDYSVYGLDLTDNRMPSVVLRSREVLDRKGAFKKLSVALALLGVYEGVGLRERASGGIGGFHSSPAWEDYEESNYSPQVAAAIRLLERANDPYQVQACFTLSRGLALASDPESAIIEFVKLIELYVKQLAWGGDLEPAAAKNVLEDKIIFSKRVKEDLRARRILTEETVDLIYKIEEVRNKFVGHRGMRPLLGELFGDPEDNRGLLDQADFNYDPYLEYGPHFFERFLNDVMLMGGFLFSKMQGLEPLVCVTPGCWSQSSKRVHDVLTEAGAGWIGPNQNRLTPAK
jgi:hypothetical protein